MKPDELKHCPICTQDLPASEFGICRARKDGRNLYCKSCIRKKVAQSRRALKEYKSARKRLIEKQIEILQSGESTNTPAATDRKSPVDKVREAIAKGKHTQREIEIETKLCKDVIGDAIATLLLWTNEIKTQLVGNTRLYFLKENQQQPVIARPQSSSLVDIARKHCGPVVRGTKEIRRIA